MNASPWTGAALFFTDSLLLGLLPFVPAWREWRHPSDAEPLPVPLRRDDARALLQRLREIAARRPARDGAPREFRIGSARALVASGDLQVAAGTTLAAALARGALELGPGCEVLEGAHADGPLRLREGCVVLRGLSSATAIELAPGCCFEDLDAPVVRFGAQRAPRRGAPPAPREAADWVTVPGASRRSAGLVHVRGDCVLGAGRRYVGSLVVHGGVALEEQAILEGDLKASRGVLLAPGARVRGAVFSDASIHLLRDTAADGPVVSATAVMLSAGACVGSPTDASSITACTVLAEAGAVAHGTVRARRTGAVWGDA